MSDTSDTAARRRKPVRRKRASQNGMPYENATSGKNAIKEMEKNLRAFGASSFGAMEQYDTGDLLVQFEWRNRKVSISVSGKGYAAQWLRRHPWSYNMRVTKQGHERRALEIGKVARYSILRDWIKGQVTAVECGILSFEAVFMPFMLTADGRPLLERVSELGELLPQPEAPKVVALPGRGPVP